MAAPGGGAAPSRVRLGKIAAALKHAEPVAGRDVRVKVADGLMNGAAVARVVPSQRG